MIVLVPLLPSATVKAVGAADRVKLPSKFTVRAKVVVSLRLPEVPVIVIVTVPNVAVVLAVRVRTLLLVAGSGLKEAVTPLGSPVAASVTLPENLFNAVMATVLVLLVPLAILSALGVAERVKWGVVPAGHLLARLATFTEPIPVAKSQPVVVP